MMILALRTDKPQAELYIYNNQQKLAELKWPAHLKLAETIHEQIEKILNQASISYKQLDGITVFKGPGSFTGLRIGFAVANALAYSLEIPIIARGGKTWLEKSLKALLAGQNDKLAKPEYGSKAHITKPKK
jgi:tRNA threonylcarbamoyladenosine biosynthesis protein TsaB